MYAWSWAGSYVTRDIDSKEKTMAPLAITQGYADESLRCCVEFGQSSLLWYQRNDTLTRGKIASLVRRGHTIGSAIPEAWRQTHLEWRSPAMQPMLQAVKTPKAPAAVDVDEMGPPAKRARQLKTDAFPTISMLKGGKKICKPHNDGRGCKGGCGLAHVCDVKLSTGKPCASSSHNRLNHREE